MDNVASGRSILRHHHMLHIVGEKKLKIEYTFTQYYDVSLIDVYVSINDGSRSRVKVVSSLNDAFNYAVAYTKEAKYGNQS